MDKAISSLMQPPAAGQQLDLLALPAGIFDCEEAHGEYTAERLFAQRPDAYRAVVILSGLGLGQIKIGRLLRVSCNTVRQVQRREGVAVDTAKQILARELMDVANLAAEGLHEDLVDPERRAKIGSRDKALIAAIATDKALLLSGEATVRIDVEVKRAGHDDFNQFLAGLATGLGAATAGQKGGGVEVIEVGPGQAVGGPADSETAGNGGKSLTVNGDADRDGTLAGSEPDRAPDLAPDRGEGGVRPGGVGALPTNTTSETGI